MREAAAGLSAILDLEMNLHVKLWIAEYAGAPDQEVAAKAQAQPY